ncbi:MAG: hypothetical protein ACP5LW_04810 [Nitrososphaeria archaeon]|nr:hypothetical protein [uncultured archaeon]
MGDCPNDEAAISKCAYTDEDPTVKLELMLATGSKWVQAGA